MTATLKKSAYDKAFIELWIDAKKKNPDLVNKQNPHFDTSTILLVHVDGVGVVPGYYLKWNRDVNKGHDTKAIVVKKGDAGYYSLKDDSKLDNVIFFYPVDKLPLKTDVIKPENTENSGNPQ